MEMCHTRDVSSGPGQKGPANTPLSERNQPVSEAPQIEYRHIDGTELEIALRQHVLFVSGKKGGKRLNLSLHDLSYLDFRGRNLNDAEFVGSRLEQALFEKASLVNGNFFGATLRRATLLGSNLTKADLRGAEGFKK